MTRRADGQSPYRNEAWPTYRLFGLTLTSDFPFASRLLPASGPADLTFTCAREVPVLEDWEQAIPVHAGPGDLRKDVVLNTRPKDSERATSYYLYRFAAHDVLRFVGAVDFYLWPNRITCHLLDPAYDYMVEIHLLGSVFSLWLERQGARALHAAAVVVGAQTVAFLSTKQGGKSSLAGALMQAGHPLLTDDLLPVEFRDGAFVGRPGYPQMRLWPEEARYFLGSEQGLERVHPAYAKKRVSVGPDGFGTFCSRPEPLGCIYLPERRDDEETRVEISPFPPRAALLALLRHSFSPRAVEAMGLQPERLDFFSRIVREVPVRRLVYPSGLEYLPRVRQAILEDLATVL